MQGMGIKNTYRHQGARRTNDMLSFPDLTYQAKQPFSVMFPLNIFKHNPGTQLFLSQTTLGLGKSELWLL